MSRRPERLQIVNELGKPQSLAAGEEQFARLGHGQETLVLGLGPDPAILASLLPGEGVAYVECPQFAEQMPERWAASIPPGWARLAPEDLTPGLLAGCQVLVYTPNAKLFPSFWGPIRAACQLAQAPGGAPPAAAGEVWLPGDEDDLLVSEIAQTLMDLGLSVRRLATEGLAAELPRLLKHGRPELFISVNFKGLDPLGESFWLMRKAGTRVAVWCVDNPFNLVSGLKSGFWRSVHLAVTDAWFVEPLRAHGAENVLHLPLAAWPSLFASPRVVPEYDLSGRVVFVGRSEFPEKQRFFAGVVLPEATLDAAMKRLDQGLRPDFAWWRTALEIERLWPGAEVRSVGLGAEQCSRAARVLTLQSAADNLPLTIFGDPGWAGLVPACKDLRGPVDYYGPLPSIYATAAACLNVTSLLLPFGLTQRHFDVWAAGGFLLTDATPGLRLFPEELTREVSFEHPGRIEGMVQRFAANPALRADLARSWRSLILAEHTYRQRLEKLLGWLAL
jgi:hypothetical protein